MTLTLVPKKRFYDLGNFKALSFSIQKLLPMLTFFVDKERNTQTQKQTDRQKLYAPDLTIPGHKQRCTVFENDYGIYFFGV